MANTERYIDEDHRHWVLSMRCVTQSIYESQNHVEFGCDEFLMIACDDALETRGSRDT